MDIFLSRLVLEAVGASISFVVLSILFISMGLMNPPEDILRVIEGWLLLCWFGGSLALFLGTLAERSEIVDKLWHPLSYLVLPLSGTSFLVDTMPERFQHVVLWIPMLHGTEIVREGYFGSLIHPHYDVKYMAGLCLIFTFLALIQERYISKRVVLE